MRDPYFRCFFFFFASATSRNASFSLNLGQAAISWHLVPWYPIHFTKKPKHPLRFREGIVFICLDFSVLSLVIFSYPYRLLAVFLFVCCHRQKIGIGFLGCRNCTKPLRTRNQSGQYEGLAVPSCVLATVGFFSGLL